MKVRIRYSKAGKIRWTSHRDVARMWERAFRRVDLPLAYSEGFSPRPKVSFGLALPTGYESDAEYLDAEVTSDFDVEELQHLVRGLSGALPAGVDAVATGLLAPSERSLQEDVTSCGWALLIEGAASDELAARVAGLLGEPAIVVARSRKGGEVSEDIRQGILHLAVSRPDPQTHGIATWLEAELTCNPSVRPGDVLTALGTPYEAGLVRRTHQWILRDGARREPLTAAPVDATGAPHALVRAS